MSIDQPHPPFTGFASSPKARAHMQSNNQPIHMSKISNLIRHFKRIVTIQKNSCHVSFKLGAHGTQVELTRPRTNTQTCEMATPLTGVNPKRKARECKALCAGTTCPGG